MALKQYRVKYLLRYTPHRQRTRLCWQITTLTAINNREARRKVMTNRNAVFVSSVKDVTHL